MLICHAAMYVPVLMIVVLMSLNDADMLYSKENKIAYIYSVKLHSLVDLAGQNRW